MPFEFRPASRTSTTLLIGLAGPSGCGKTYSALALARGLAGPDGRVAMIDTEACRGLHYAGMFDFDHGDLRAPFSPEAYTEAIMAADNAGYDAIVIDSMSHEYEGEGGLIEWAAAEESGVPKPGVVDPEPWKRDHWIKQPVKSPGNWAAPKSAHKKMMGKLLQVRAHLIFCMRAEEKMLVKNETDDNGRRRTTVVAAADRPILERWQAIAEKRFAYELTASFLLLPDNPGVPLPLKLQEQHKAAFPAGERVSERSGAKLAEWAGTDNATTRHDVHEPVDIRQAGTDAASEGTAALQAWFKALTKEQKAELKDFLDSTLKPIAAIADDSGGCSDE